MPNYPVNIASLPTVTRRTKFSVGWAGLLRGEFKAAQSDYANACGEFSTLASFLAVAHNSVGIVSGARYHTSVLAVTSAQHHAQTHAATHQDGTDDIPTASVGGRGFMSSVQFVKLTSIAATSTRNRVRAGTYTGSGAGPLAHTVTLGFPAQEVRIMRDTTVGGTYFSWHWHRGVSAVTAESSTAHRQTDLADVFFDVNGFAVSLGANESGIPYRYVAIG
jgi:hypothetical protein